MIIQKFEMDRRMRKLKKDIVEYVSNHPGTTEVDIAVNCRISKKSLFIDDLMERGEIIGIPCDIYISEEIKPLKRIRFFTPWSWAERVKVFREIGEMNELDDETPFFIKHKKAASCN